MRKTKRIEATWIIVCAVLVLAVGAQAQFTASYQTNIIDGVTNSWTGENYYIGNNFDGDALLIQNDGGLTNISNLYIGNLASDSDNLLVVDGADSVLNNVGYQYVGYDGDNNQMIITNGGTVRVATTVPYTSMMGNNGQGNVAIVTGSNSLWDVRILTMGSSHGHGNLLRIVDGGRVVAKSSGNLSAIGMNANNNTIEVSDPGSSLDCLGGLYVGRGHAGPVYASGNVLSITNGGTANISKSLIIGNSTNAGNMVCVDGGNLLVTISTTRDRYISIPHGTLKINSGNVTADKLLLEVYISTANPSSLQFNGGNLSVRNTVANNESPFVVGNGDSAAVLNLISESSIVGSHSFSNELVIANNATLSIGGTNVIREVTINGDMTLHTGAILDFDFNQTTTDYAQVNGTVTLPKIGTLQLRALDTSTRFPLTVLEATQIIGKPSGWPVVTVNDQNYKMYVDENQLVLDSPRPLTGTVIVIN